jgi:hypothetical protein
MRLLSSIHLNENIKMTLIVIALYGAIITITYLAW